MKSKITIGLILVLALSLNYGCKVTRHSQRSSLDSTKKESVDYSRIDTGTIVIYEKIDTTVVVPGVGFNSWFKLNPLPDGFKFPGFAPVLAQMGDAMVELKLSYDSLSNSIQATGNTKPQTIPLQKERITTEKKGISEKLKSETEERVKKKENQKFSEKKPDRTWVFGLGLVLAGIAIVLFLRLKAGV